MAHKKKEIEQINLCEGAYLEREFFEKKENRILTLLLKGIIVYLLSMGSIGFYLTAFNISFNVVLCHVLILLVSLGCAMLYYRLLVENLGYLFLFVVFAFLVFTFRDYINSGFYAIVNITVDNAAQYFDVDIQKLYAERIADRYVTVTFVALFIGIVLDILLNVYISRRMQYGVAAVIIMALNLIPLYLVMEPDMLYVIMMLVGMSMALIFKAGKHYSPQIATGRSDNKFHIRGKRKKEIAYVYDIKAMVQAGVQAAAFALLVVILVSTLKPKENFNTGYGGNKYKDLSASAMTALLVDGWESFYGQREYNGGIHGGKLGDVSTVYLDHQTDLVVKMTPYTDERIYLKAFTGIRYNPYENQWTSISDMNGYEEAENSQEEAESLKNSYEGGNPYSAKAKMHIQCAGVSNQLYEPYYLYDTVEDNTKGYEVVYYPRLEENSASVSYSSMPYQDGDLYVPEENRETIADFVDQLGFIGTDEQIVQAVKNYYQENYPYTVRPGKTPKKKDFVNYFLTDNQKGYCAHYASAAVLIFRYLGIPARYVEGYAIDYDQMLSGELAEGEKYSDYYDGYSEIGETACIEVNVTDADAHAWVEIYDPVKGWYPVDVTPASDEEEEVTDFWSDFAEFMDGNDDIDEGDGEIQENNNALTISDELVKKVIYGIGLIIILVVLAIFGIKGIRKIRFAIHFARAGYSDKLILSYHAMLQKYKKKEHGISDCYNYREQVSYMIAHMQDGETKDHLCDGKEQIIDILQRAGFSNRLITEAEYLEVSQALKDMTGR